MKLIFIAHITLLFFTQLLATNKALCQGMPHDVHITDYVGTWVGSTADGDLKIILEEKAVPLVGEMYNAIIGRHAYTSKRSNKSSIKNESLSNPEGEFALFGVPDSKNNNVLPMIFRDEVNGKSILIELSFISEGKKKIHWQLKQVFEVVKISKNQVVLPGISVPTDIILKKAE